MKEIKVRLLLDNRVVGYLRLDGGWTQFQAVGETEWSYPCSFKWAEAELNVDHKDSKKQDMYEGDMVRDGDNQIHVIVWGGHWKYAAFGLGGKRTKEMGEGPEYYWDPLNPETACCLEVIGNIHEEKPCTR